MPKSFVVVVDTSVLVSGFLTAGPTKEILELASLGHYGGIRILSVRAFLGKS